MMMSKAEERKVGEEDGRPTCISCWIVRSIKNY